MTTKRHLLILFCGAVAAAAVTACAADTESGPSLNPQPLPPGNDDDKSSSPEPSEESGSFNNDGVGGGGTGGSPPPASADPNGRGKDAGAPSARVYQILPKR